MTVAWPPSTTSTSTTITGAKESNPIYGKEDSANSYGISGTVFYKEPFGWKDWSFNATAGYYEEDNDIDFYDTEVGVVVFAMLRRF